MRRSKGNFALFDKAIYRHLIADAKYASAESYALLLRARFRPGNSVRSYSRKAPEISRTANAWAGEILAAFPKMIAGGAMAVVWVVLVGGGGRCRARI